MSLRQTMLFQRLGTLVFLLHLSVFEVAAQRVVSGIIKSRDSNEAIPYANIYVKEDGIGVSSNSYGFYSLVIPHNRTIEITFSSLGYREFRTKLLLTRDSSLNVDLEPFYVELSPITFSAKEEDHQNSSAGHIQLDLATAQQTPTLLGEKDLLKTIQLLPGVQRSMEGSTALYVRGGSPDQNLLLLDDATVYNANHLFGFFSVFNGDAVKRVDFFKGAMPARYGGRISSIVDMQMKDGNQDKLTGSAGIGLLSSRVTLTGPLIKNKTTFLVSARRSYLDLLITPFISESSKSSYVLQDFNTKISHKIGKRDKIIISGYFGFDRLKATSKDNSDLSRTNLRWGNMTVTSRWNHVLSKKLFLNTTFLYTGFNFKLENEVVSDNIQSRNDVTSNASAIRDFSVKSDLDIFATNQHTLKTGFLITNHFYRPRIFRQENFATGENLDTIRTYSTNEMAVYFEDRWKATKKMTFDFGIRLSALATSKKIYRVLEPRASINYTLPYGLTLSGSYSRSNQFVHLLSSTGIGLSTDLWVPVTPTAPPQQADQFSAGIIKEFERHGLSISVEAYRKYMRNIIAYKEGATFLNLSNTQATFDWEKNITSGKGLSYGTEVFLEKRIGAFTGWVAYTLAWVVHSFDEMNEGKPFFPKFDSRHNLNLHLSYRISPKASLSAAWMYNSPAVFSAPHAFYPVVTTFFSQPFYIPSNVPYFGSQNSFRGDAFHRLDIAFKLYKKKRLFSRTWEFGIYNVYNRHNPLYYYLSYRFDNDKNTYVADVSKRSLFPIIPSVTYSIEF